MEKSRTYLVVLLPNVVFVTNITYIGILRILNGSFSSGTQVISIQRVSSTE